MGWISRMGEGKRKDKDEKGDIKCYGMVTDNTVHMVTMIMYGSEIWVVTGDILKVLEGFHHRVARRITGMTATRGVGGEREYPPVVAAMESAGLHTIVDYIRRRQENIAEKVACCPVYKLCVEAERMPGTIRMVRWWYQDVVNEPEE